MSVLRKEINQVLIKIKEGDNASKAVLFEKTYNHLFHIAYQKLRDKSEAEDVVSDSYLKAFRYINSFNPLKDGYNWLCKIVQNCAYNRNKKYREFVPLEDAEEEAVTKDFSETLAAKDEVDGLLQGYGERDCAIMKLRYLQNMSFSQIAKRLDMKKSTVHKRVTVLTNEILKKHTPKGGQKK